MTTVEQHAFQMIQNHGLLDALSLAQTKIDFIKEDLEREVSIGQKLYFQKQLDYAIELQLEIKKYSDDTN
jgi:hypothetical protein